MLQKKKLDKKNGIIILVFVLLAALNLIISFVIENRLIIYLFNMPIMLFIGIVLGNKWSSRNLQQKNNELNLQKNALTVLWDETDKLNKELLERNKSINQQKKSYENLWEQTIELNDELIKKNKMLASLNENISNQQEKLLMLNSIGEYMVSSSNIDEVLTNIIFLTKRILNFSTARILEYNPQKDTLELILAVGYPQETGIKEITLNEGITGYAARKKEIVYVSDVSKDHRYIRELDETKAELSIPLLVKDELVGVLDLQNDEPFISHEDKEQFLLLKVLGNHTAMVLKNYQLTEDARQRFLDIVKALVRAIEAKDLYTSGHCERVKDIAVEIGDVMNLSQEELETLELAALLHDIGKIGMPESILNNKGKLTKEQYNLIKKHPLIGYQMLEDILPLKRINTIILQHHERIDGKGYPKGLIGEEIDPLAKIISVADAVDAMTSVRPYRPVESFEYVINQLEVCSGTQFDEKVAEIAKEILIKKRKRDLVVI